MATPTIITQGAMSQDSSGVNKYNPNTGNLLLPGQSVQVNNLGQLPPTIPAGVGLGNTQAPSLPNTPTGSAANQISGAAAGFMAMPALDGAKNFGTQLSNANNVANANAQQGQQDYQSQVLGLINQMQNRPGELEQQYGIQKLSADALSAKANYDSVELAYRRQKEATMTDGAISREQKAATISEIERKEASQKADIAIDYNLKQGLLSNAKELMQKQIALELEPMKLKVDYYKDNRDRFDKILDKTEMRQYDYVQKKEERAYQAAQKAADRKANLIEKAIDNGTYTSDMKNMSFDQIAEKIGIGTAAKSITPLTKDGKPDVVEEAGNVIKLAKKDVPGASSAIGVMSSLQKFASDNKEGAFIGAATVRGRNNLRRGEARKEYINNQSAIDAINLKVQQWASGASLTEEQTKQVKRLVPDKNDTDFKIKEKINNLTQFMQQQVKAELAAKGISYDPTQVDYFAPSATEQLDVYVSNTPNGVSTQYSTTLEESWNAVSQN